MRRCWSATVVLRFGVDRQRGLRLNPKTIALEAVTIGEDGVGENDILVHDQGNRTLATMLAALQPPAMPVALGVLYAEPAMSLDEAFGDQEPVPGASPLTEQLNALLRRGDTWMVAG